MSESKRKTPDWPPPTRPRTRVLAAFALLSIAVFSAVIGGTWAVLILGPGGGDESDDLDAGAVAGVETEASSAAEPEASVGEQDAGVSGGREPLTYASVHGGGRIAIVGLDGRLRSMDAIGGKRPGADRCGGSVPTPGLVAGRKQNCCDRRIAHLGRRRVRS